MNRSTQTLITGGVGTYLKTQRVSSQVGKICVRKRVVKKLNVRKRAVACGSGLRDVAGDARL